MYKIQLGLHISTIYEILISVSDKWGCNAKVIEQKINFYERKKLLKPLSKYFENWKEAILLNPVHVFFE